MSKRAATSVAYDNCPPAASHTCGECNRPVSIDALLREYAGKAEAIYERRTAGDNTWLGLLAEFSRKAGLL